MGPCVSNFFFRTYFKAGRISFLQEFTKIHVGNFLKCILFRKLISFRLLNASGACVTEYRLISTKSAIGMVGQAVVMAGCLLTNFVFHMLTLSLK